jgi:hypothetical protein
MFVTFLFISKAFVFAQLPGAAVGFIVGAFTPAIGRKIKALFVKETQKAVIAIKAEVVKAATDVSKKV